MSYLDTTFHIHCLCFFDSKNNKTILWGWVKGLKGQMKFPWILNICPLKIWEESKILFQHYAVWKPSWGEKIKARGKMESKYYMLSDYNMLDFVACFTRKKYWCFWINGRRIIVWILKVHRTWVVGGRKHIPRVFMGGENHLSKNWNKHRTNSGRLANNSLKIIYLNLALQFIHFHANYQWLFFFFFFPNSWHEDHHILGYANKDF